MSYIVRTQFDGYSRDGHRSYNKGGGGGGSAYYENQNKLLGVQADIAQNMYNTYADYAPTRLSAMSKMADEAMDGTLADRARNQAAADAGASLGTSLQGAQRSLERYGTTLNPNALNANLTNTALSEAAVRSGAMNRAQQWAEGQKWARTSDFYGALQGMPGTATQALGSAASGYGQMQGQQNQVNMANAMGYGQLGGMIGYGLMARDGGYIHDGEVIRRDDEPGYAMGGMPRLKDWRSYDGGSAPSDGTPSPVGQVAAGAVPMVGAHLASPYIKQGLGAIKEGAAGAWDKIVAGMKPAASAPGDLATVTPSAAGDIVNGAQTGANALNGASGAAANAAGDIATVVPSATGDIVNGVATGANALGESAVAAGAAEAGAAAGTTAAAGTDAALLAAAPEAAALGPLGWGALAIGGTYALGSAMDWWADGGPVPHEQPRGLRMNMQPGGHVQGPGTETSDSIPAWLSDGEYVINADAVKEVGKKKLEKINEKGLKKRRAKAKAAAPKAAGMKKPVKK